MKEVYSSFGRSRTIDNPIMSGFWITVQSLVSHFNVT